MKVLVLFGLFLVALLQIDARSLGLQFEETPNAFKEIVQQSFVCRMELGVHKFKDLPKRSGSKLLPEDNESLNALWGCIFKKKGIINERSEINEEHLESYLWDVATMVGKTSPEFRNSIQDLTKDCMNVHGEDYGQTSVKIQNCAMRLATERGLRK